MNMALEAGKFVLNGHPFFIYSGEIHYFRIAPDKWRLHLQKAKKAGLNTVSSYIPWIWHEPEEGKFDFSGQTHPQRNLKKFLQLVEEMGLYFIPRVGPISNAELVNEGLPAWLLKKHPEIYSAGSGIINLPHVTILSYLHPVFHEYVEKWYRKVLPIIQENQLSAGGRMILLQLCNEIGMVAWVNKCGDYNPNTDKLYRQFLKDKYQKIDFLNQAWKTSHANFDQLIQPREETTGKNFQMFFDWALFYRNYYASYFASLTRLVKEKEITLPLIANIPQFYDFDVRGRGVYSPMTTSFYRNFPDYVGPVVMGGAYQMRRLDYENFHDISITTEAVRMTSQLSPPADFYPIKLNHKNFNDALISQEAGDTDQYVELPVFCAELQFGIMRDRPRLYPSDVELNLKTSTAHGLNGLNGYMFSGGVNLPELAAFGRYHEWQAPVSSTGEERDHFRPIQEFGRLIKTYGQKLAQTKKFSDTALGFYLPYFTSEFLHGKWVELLEAKRNGLFFDGIARLLQLAGLNFSMVDIQRASLNKLLEYPRLWVFSLEFMDRVTQKKLTDYVKAGGILILNPELPVKDLTGEKETYLAEEFSFNKLEKIAGATVQLKDKGPVKDCYVSGDISVFHSPESQVLAESSSGHSCAMMKKIGKGKLMFLGFGLSHIYDYQVDLVKSWAAKLGLQPKITVQPADIQAVLRSGEDFAFLFLFNYHQVSKEVKVSFSLDGSKTVYRLPGKKKIVLEPNRGYLLPINLKLDEEYRINYSTLEILSFQKKPKELILHLRQTTLPTWAEISFNSTRLPKKVKVDGQPVSFKRQGQNFLISFTAPAGTKELRLQF
ncbi:MAG: beta-galactosidase [Elusimicrobiota bacterium]